MAGESPETLRLSPRARWSISIGTALVVVVVDQLSKSWALSSLTIGVPKPVAGPFQFNLAFNTGMAFSRGASSGPLIGIVALVIVGAMLFYVRSSATRLQAMTMGLVIGGALGNVIDRLFRDAAPLATSRGFMGGAVVDFIDVGFWPIFNIADSAVVVGGILLAISVMFVGDGAEG